MAFVLAAILHGCAWNWDERDMAMLSVGCMDWAGLPVAAAGPQPFGLRDGRCYYVYKTEVRDLVDDALVAHVVPTPGRWLPRVVMLEGRGLLAVDASMASFQRETKLAWKCDLVKLRDDAGAEAFCAGQGQVTELSCTSPSERVVLALQTQDRDGHLDSVIAACAAGDGHELLRQDWDVRDLIGLDCTPDGELFVCAGRVEGVQGVYVGRGPIRAVPALLMRDAQYPSISADGSTIAMSRCEPTRTMDRVEFREQASVTLMQLGTGETREIAIAPNALVCGTRYLENPTRLLVFGLRSEPDGKAVWWVIWNVGSEGVVSELRAWKCARGDVAF